jgi:hypothetical protein
MVPGAAAMWDLTVSNVHTFAVGAGEFVVHNNRCTGGRSYQNTQTWAVCQGVDTRARSKE